MSPSAATEHTLSIPSHRHRPGRLHWVRGPPDLLKVEHGLDQEVWCWSIAAKRYALYTHSNDGHIELVDRKEHGLGHLNSPLDNRAEFYNQWWTQILNLEHGIDACSSGLAR